MREELKELEAQLRKAEAEDNEYQAEILERKIEEYHDTHD